jgi:hypothetical protein
MRRILQLLSQKESLTLYSPHPPSVCMARRLTLAIHRQSSALFSFGSILSTKSVAGQVALDSLKLRKRINYRNSFQTFLIATMKPHEKGTLIQGDFVLHPLVRAFGVFWFGGVVIIGGCMLILTIFSYVFGFPHHDDHAWLMLIGPPAMLLFDVLLLKVGRYSAKGEAQFLSEFLIELLDAHYVV